MKTKLQKLVSIFKEEGVKKAFNRSAYFISSRIRRIGRYPSMLTRFGISKGKWEKMQVDHELDFWNDPEKHESLDGHTTFREKYFNLNKNMFKNICLNFPEGIVADIGCGPETGFLPFCQAKLKIGIEPLAEDYSKKYQFDNGILMLPAMAEKIPLISSTVDACYCINALDHMMKPQESLEEMYRILKPGGYFAFSVDIGGTKGHPVKIYEKDMDNFFKTHAFKIIEKECSTDKISSWGPNSGIPLYVFQGIKL